MAKNASSNEDPSIEEILDSIRQIISEDDSEPEEEVKPSAFDVKDFDPPVEKPAPVPPPMPEPIEEVVDPFEDDVFELTDKIEDEPDEKPNFEVDLIDIEPEPEPVVEEEPRFEAPKIQVEPDPDAILTEAAENAAYEAMSSLVRKTAVEHNGITLEDIVRAELKPLLRAWLDKNLPIIIDRLVREELERVSKRALDE